jgi:hypothetical protein
MAGFYEHSNEIKCSVKGGKFVGHLSGYKFLKKDFIS